MNRGAVLSNKNVVEIKKLKTELAQVKSILEQTQHEMSLIEEINTLLTSSCELEDIMNTIMPKIKEITQAKKWAVYLYNETSKKLTLRFAHLKKIPFNKVVRLGEGFTGGVAQQGRPVIVENMYNDDRIIHEKRVNNHKSSASLLSLPIINNGSILGVVELSHKRRGNAFTKKDIELVARLAHFVAIAIQRESLQQKVEELAITDDLTHLFNSRYLHRTIDVEIERCIRSNTSLSLIFIDIDYFKKVNDRHGHLVGSKVLIEIGHFFKKNIRKIDIIARYGGDEFVIILPRTAPQYAVEIAERLRKGIEKNAFLKKECYNVKITASFGIASFPENAHEKDELIRLADEAMYKVKARSRNGVFAINIQK